MSGYMKKIVKLVKLVSGEEILATVVGETAQSLVLAEMILVGLQRDPQTQKLGLAVMPFAPSSVGQIEVARDKVVFVAEPNTKALEIHAEAFSVVETASQGLVLPRSR